MGRRIPPALIGLACLAMTPASPSAGSSKPPAMSLAGSPARFARLDGYRVRYKTLGRGREALVFIHGWGGDLNVWEAPAEAFAPRARVLALDLPGHGGSDKPQLRYTMDLFARAVGAVMRGAGVDRAVLVGHSMGTPVARQFYRLYPKKTLALVAADGSLKPYLTDSAAIASFVAPYRGAGHREALARTMDSMFSPATPARARERIQEAMLSTPQDVIVGSLEAMFDPAIWKEDPIRVPLLCILASNPYWSEQYESYVRELAPRLQFRVVEGAGHFLMVDRPEEFHSILAHFLEENRLLRR